MRKCFLVFLFAVILVFPAYSLAQSLPDLSADSQSVAVPGKQYYQNVSLTRGALVKYQPNPKDERIIGITCNIFLLDASSSIVYGATSPHGTSVPLSLNKDGTPDIKWNGELRRTEGNGAGSHGGRGFNASGLAKEPYGSAAGFDLTSGSVGTAGETFVMWLGGSQVTIEGRAGGRTAGRISIIGNDVVVEGILNANGESGWGELCETEYPGYSGSGGTILIAAKNLTITGTARITANGGEYPLKEHCDQYGRPFHYQYELVGKRDGGGGRIKIFYEQGTISPEAIIEAKGWEDGTVHIQRVPSIEDLIRPEADINKDGVVDSGDLLILHKQWHQALTPIPVPADTPTPSPTPEP